MRESRVDLFKLENTKYLPLPSLAFLLLLLFLFLFLYFLLLFRHLLSPFQSSFFLLFLLCLPLFILPSYFNLSLLPLFLFLLPLSSPFPERFFYSQMPLAMWSGGTWKTQKSSWKWEDYNTFLTPERRACVACNFPNWNVMQPLKMMALKTVTWHENSLSTTFKWKIQDLKLYVQRDYNCV